MSVKPVDTSRLALSCRAALLLSVTLAAAAGGGAGGCVERELAVDSNPQGAIVYLNDQLKKQIAVFEVPKSEAGSVKAVLDAKGVHTCVQYGACNAK